MVSKNDIFRLIQDHRRELRALGVKSLGLFGSHARGDARADSDIDFLVELERRTFDDYMGTKLLLEDLFGRKVDLVLVDRIKPELRETILAEVVHGPEF